MDGISKRVTVLHSTCKYSTTCQTNIHTYTYHFVVGNQDGVSYK